MKKSCIKTRRMFNDYKNGSLKDMEVIKEVRDHIKSCTSCRDFALDKSLSPLLSASFEGPSPEPSPSFFVNLSRKIEEIDRQTESSLFSEIFISASLKLVPAMAAVLFFITATTAFFYKSSPAETNDYSMEEMVLFDEGEISMDTFLSEILKNEVKNGK